MPTRFDRFVQEGRDCFLVRYATAERGALYADLVPAHLEHLADHFAARGLVDAVDRLPDGRQEVLASVRQALSAPEGSARHEVADDIAIWWFFEYLDGRGEDHIVEDWQRIVPPKYPLRADSPTVSASETQSWLLSGRLAAEKIALTSHAPEPKPPRGFTRTERKARR